MARIEIATSGWGWVTDSFGNGRANVSVLVLNLDTSPVTVWSAVTGGTAITPLLTNDLGIIPGFIDSGTYNVTIDSVTRRVEAALGTGGGGGGAVSSVFGRSGAVVAQSGDYTSAQVGAPPSSRAITSGTGLVGGGDLTADRSLAPDFGIGAGKVTQGNDSRLSDARTPTTHHTTHEPGGTDAIAVDAIAATGSLRTLGPGTSQAAQGSVVATHITDTTNPHSTTKTQVGLGSVDNTADTTKSITGDVTGTLGATAVAKLRGKNVPAPGASEDGKGFYYDDASGAYIWGIAPSVQAALNLKADASAAALKADVQVFLASGTWTQPAGAKAVEVIVIGPGGPGASGAVDTAANVGAGGLSMGAGGAGGGGAGARALFRAADLGATEAVTVGLGTAGGIGRTTAGSGALGTAPTDSAFAGVRANAGSRGGGGASGAAGSGGLAGAYGTILGTSGGAAALAGAGLAGSTSNLGGSPGGGGGGSTSSAGASIVPRAGGAGGINNAWNMPGVAGGAAATGATPGGNGAAGTTNTKNVGPGSGGGGGGGGNATALGGKGGDGGFPGGGGGGGGGGVVEGGGTQAGGAGANGIVVVITYF